MSLQWNLVAAFMYSEIAVVLLMLLPVLSPQVINKILKSRFVKAIENQTHWYFGLMILILGLFFLDAVREMRKYSMPSHGEFTTLDTEMQHNMRLFRAQRNFYISGFALFLSLVIQRLAALISKQAQLLAENEAALKQAKSATNTARNLLSQSGGGEASQNSSNEAHQKEIAKLNEIIESLKTDVNKANKDKEAVIEQSKSLEREYDRLSKELSKVQVAAKDGSKKDE